MHDPHSALATVRVAGEPYQLLTSGQLQTQLNDTFPAPLPHDHHQVMAVVDTIASTLTDNASLKAALGGEVDRTRLLNAIRYGKLKVFAGEVLPEHWFPMTRTVAPETAPDATPPVTPQIAPEQAGTGRDTTCWLYRTEIAHPHPDTQHQIRFRDVGWSPADEAARTQHTARSCLAMTETNSRRRARVSLVVRANGSSPPFVYPLGEGLPGVEKTRDPGPVATTLMPVVPVVNDSEASVPDEGWIYIFRNNRLWRMLKAAPGGVFHDSHHELARKHDSAPHADGLGLRAIWVPLQINGQRESSLDMLYSPTLLPWGQVTDYEADPAKRLEVSTDLTPLTGWVNDQAVPDAFVLPEGLEDRPASAAVHVMPANARQLRLAFAPPHGETIEALQVRVRFDEEAPTDVHYEAGTPVLLNVPESARKVWVQAEPVSARHQTPWTWDFDLREAPEPDAGQASQADALYLSQLNHLPLPKREALRHIRLKREHWACTELPSPDDWREVASQSRKLRELASKWQDTAVTETALPPGWLYVFRGGYLWAEYQVDSQAVSKPDPARVSLRPVDLQQLQGQDARPAQPRKAIPLHTLRAPEDEAVEVAFSHVQWSWAQINAMGGLRPEPDPERPDWPWYDPAYGAPLASEDNRLADPSPDAAAKRREARCLEVEADQREVILPDPEGLLHTAAMRLNTAWSLIEQLVADMAEMREAPSGIERYLDAAILTWSWLHQPPPQNAATPWARDKAHYLQQQRLQASVDEKEIRRILRVDERQTLRELIRAGKQCVLAVLEHPVGRSTPVWLASVLSDRLALPAGHPNGLTALHEILSSTLGPLQTPETSICRTLQLDDALQNEHKALLADPRINELLKGMIDGNHAMAAIISPWKGEATWTWQNTLKDFVDQLNVSWEVDSITPQALADARKAWLSEMDQLASPPTGPSAGISAHMLNFVDEMAKTETLRALQELARKGERVTPRWVRQALRWPRTQLAVFGGLLVQSGNYMNTDARKHKPLATVQSDKAPVPADSASPKHFHGIQTTVLSPTAENALTRSRLCLFGLNAWLALSEVGTQPNTRNALNALGSTLDLFALSGEKAHAVAKRLATNAPASTGWISQLIRHPEWAKTFAKRLPFVGGTIGTVVSGIDFASATYQRDDVQFAYAAQVLGGALATTSALMGLIGAASAVAPPLALLGGASMIIGLLLQHTILHENDLMQLWLVHGPFASAAPENRLPVNESRLPFIVPPETVTGPPMLETTLGPLCQFRYGGIRACLAVRTSEPPASTLTLYLHKAGVLLVLDTRYRLLGLMDYRPSQAGRNLRQVIRLTGNGQISLKLAGQADQPLGTFGQPVADSLGTLLDKTRDWRNSTRPAPRDTSDRLDTGWLDRWMGEDEDKFIAPVRQHPKAATELLLSALYPVEMKSVIVSHENPGQDRGNVVVTRLSVPFFIEGQSRLIFELRVTGGWWGWGDDLWGVDLMYQNVVKMKGFDSSKEGPALIIPTLLQLQKWHGDVRKPGVYADERTQEVVIVQSFGFDDLEIPQEALDA
ncbi:MAG: hypothetical protein D6758_12365, partial [Gammaproteobacteria bacterium]